MGGITTIEGGDWQQILPVIPKGSQQETVSASLHNSYLWQHTIILKLRVNMRLDHSPEENVFAQWLLDVGEVFTLPHRFLQDSGHSCGIHQPNFHYSCGIEPFPGMESGMVLRNGPQEWSTGMELNGMHYAINIQI